LVHHFLKIKNPSVWLKERYKNAAALLPSTESGCRTARMFCVIHNTKVMKEIKTAKYFSKVTSPQGNKAPSDWDRFI